jgi:predicted GIY-YIG superfamily endonuclease
MREIEIDFDNAEFFDVMIEAIKREKQIKSWSRKRKNALICATNPS